MNLFERKYYTLEEIKNASVNELKFTKVSTPIVGEFYFDEKGNTIRYEEEMPSFIERTPLNDDLTVWEVTGEKQLKLFHILVNNTTNGTYYGL